MDENMFVTYEELMQLGAVNLIGSKRLQAHLHGYKINRKLYESLRLKEQGFDFETYKQTKIEEAIKKEVEDKIYLRGDKMKVNKKIYKTKDLKKKIDSRFTDRL